MNNCKFTVEDLNDLLQALCSVTDKWDEEKRRGVGLMLIAVDGNDNLYTSNTSGLDVKRTLGMALLAEMSRQPNASFTVESGGVPVPVAVPDVVIGDEEIPITVGPVLDTKLN